MSPTTRGAPNTSPPVSPRGGIRHGTPVIIKINAFGGAGPQKRYNGKTGTAQVVPGTSEGEQASYEIKLENGQVLRVKEVNLEIYLIKNGTRVRVHGIKTQSGPWSRYNGKTGTVESVESYAETNYRVKMSDGGTLGFKRGNLTIVSSRPAG